MAHSISSTQKVNRFRPLLDKERVARRTFLWNMAVLALAGGGLTQLTTACDQTSGTSPTSQATASAPGRTIYTYRGHSQGVLTVAWSPDSKRIASGSLDKTVQIWNAADGSNVFTYRGHSSEVKALAWSPDGKRIVSGDSANMVMVWQAP